jgi:hypothetical protein
MSGRRFSVERIVRKLRQAEVALAKGHLWPGDGRHAGGTSAALSRTSGNRKLALRSPLVDARC